MRHMNKKVFLDIDGVLADFSSHFFQCYDVIEDKTSPILEWGDERITKNFHLCVDDYDFWLSIPPLISPEDISFTIDGYCTQRPVPNWVTERWLFEKGFPSAPVFSVAGSKTKVLLNENVSIFLDDAPHNFHELNDAGIRAYLLDKPYNRNIDTNLRVSSVEEFGVFAKTSILIVGNKRHGKTTVAEMIREISGLKFSDSSVAASEIFIYEKLRNQYGYYNSSECFEDRKNRRAEWFNLICEYNKEDPARLAKEILRYNDIYVGMRSKKELLHCKENGLFDVVIGVYDKRKPLEDRSSFDFDVFDSDIVIHNDGSLEDLKDKVANVLIGLCIPIIIC